MEQLLIELEGRKTAYLPGETVRGKISWSCVAAPKTAELRLFWSTRGKGTVHSELVEGLRYDPVSPHETHSFEFKLPAEPYSFSGKLITLTWMLGLDVAEADGAATEEIIVSPFGKEVRLHQ